MKLLALVMPLLAIIATALTARLQPAVARPSMETMDIGDEPGRISSEEATITDGPFARQMVFFRTTEPPGTLVVHTSERFLYVVMGNSRALRYGLGSSGRASSRFRARRNGRTGRRRPR